jgi:hypothetical protein
MTADSIWWSDERPDSFATVDHWCLRPVFRYRTAMLTGESAEDCLSYWTRAKELFPAWPGFCSARVTSTPDIVAFYNLKSKLAIDSLLDGVDTEFREECRRELEE